MMKEGGGRVATAGGTAAAGDAAGSGDADPVGGSDSPSARAKSCPPGDVAPKPPAPPIEGGEDAMENISPSSPVRDEPTKSVGAIRDETANGGVGEGGGESSPFAGAATVSDAISAAAAVGSIDTGSDDKVDVQKPASPVAKNELPKLQPSPTQSESKATEEKSTEGKESHSPGPNIVKTNLDGKLEALEEKGSSPNSVSELSLVSKEVTSNTEIGPFSSSNSSTGLTGQMPAASLATSDLIPSLSSVDDGVVNDAIDEASIAVAAALEAEILQQQKEIEDRQKEIEERRQALVRANEKRRQALLEAKRRKEQAILQAKRQKEQAILQAKRQQEQARHAELLRQQQLQKQEEARRLLQEAERLKEEADKLDRLQRLPQEAEELRRTHAVQRETVAVLQGQIEQATRQQRSEQRAQAQRWKQQQQGHLPPPPPSDNFSTLSYSSGGSSEQSPYRLRHKNNGTIKRRPRGGRSEFIDTAIDVESQTKHSIIGEDSSPIKSRANALAFVANTNSLASVGLLLRKIVMDVLTDQDDEALGREDIEAYILIITLLVEAIVGILLAFAALTFTLFLYNHFVPTLPTTHNFKMATFALIDNNQTLREFEAEKGLKFMDMREYTTVISDIQEAKNRTRTAEAMLRTRSDQVAAMKKEMETDRYANQIPEMISALKLDFFCGQCVWSISQKLTCSMRVTALKETYNTPKYTAMKSAMEKESCRKSAQQVKEEKELKEQMDALLGDWDRSQKDFCVECEWDAGTNMSCQARIEYLHQTYKMDLELAKAELMVKSKRCTYSYRVDDNRKLARFCPDCEWGYQTSCGQRVEYLMSTYGSTKRMAKLSAMKKPECAAEKNE